MVQHGTTLQALVYGIFTIIGIAIVPSLQKKWKTIDVYYPGVVETCVIWEREVSSIKLPTMSIQGNETQSWSFSNHPGILARIGT
jgi:hypothetical protein